MTTAPGQPTLVLIVGVKPFTERMGMSKSVSGTCAQSGSLALGFTFTFTPCGISLQLAENVLLVLFGVKVIALPPTCVISTSQPLGSTVTV